MAEKAINHLIAKIRRSLCGERRNINNIIESVYGQTYPTLIYQSS